jgi:hypothetical protein
VELLNFTVEVGASGIRVDKPHGGKFTEYVRPNLLDMQLLRVLEESVGRGELVDDDELSAYGSLLYRTIFVGDVHTALQETRAERKPDESIHIQLAFDDDAIGNELAGLSWEYLHYPGTRYRPGYYFLDEDYLTISRLMLMDKPKPENLVLEDSRRVQIWIIVADPPDPTEPENPDREMKTLGEGGPAMWKKTVEHVKQLQTAVNQARPNSVVVRVFDAPSAEDLTTHEVKDGAGDATDVPADAAGDGEVGAGKYPDIIHFIGHGKFKPSEGGQVALLKGNAVDWRSASTFRALIRELGGEPRLILLQQCESGRSDFSNGFTGIADKLGREVSPAVVAMQHKILNEDAIDFFRDFYSDLFKSGDVLSALQAGRGKLRRRGRVTDRRTFGTPVLHLYSKNAQIFVIPSDEAPPPEEQAAPDGAARAAVTEPRANGKESPLPSDLLGGISKQLNAIMAQLKNEAINSQLKSKDPNRSEGEPADSAEASAAPTTPADSSAGTRTLSAAEVAVGDALRALSATDSVKLGQQALRGTRETRQ